MRPWMVVALSALVVGFGVSQEGCPQPTHAVRTPRQTPYFRALVVERLPGVDGGSGAIVTLFEDEAGVCYMVAVGAGVAVTEASRESCERAKVPVPVEK